MTVRTGPAGLATIVAAVALAAALAAPAGVAWGDASVSPYEPGGQPVSISLSGVSCPRGPGCLAVGQELTARSLGRDFAQASHGRRWRVLAPPSPGVLAGLGSVACARPDRCIAVGSYAGTAGPGRALALAWNGRRWRVLAPARPAGSELLGVSCPQPDGCTAVGDLFTASGRHTFAEAWNGTRWRILPAADTHSPDSELVSVSCHSASRCLAVGFRSRQTPAGLLTLTLAEIWDGLRWRVLQTPSPGTVLSDLAGVSCGAAASCVAVGGYLDRGQPLEKPLAETWNGTRWRTTPVPGQGTGGSLLGISCPAARCVAIGAEATTTRSGPVADEWDGTRWHRLPGPEPAAAHDNLVSISCPRAGRCVAVGDSFGHAGTARALAEEWNGRQWHLINRTQHDPA